MTHYITIILLLFGISAPAYAANEPTLARLSFWVPPAPLKNFAGFCTDQVVPFLQERGLQQSTRTFAPASASLFCLLFEATAPDSFYAINKALSADPAWQQHLEVYGMIEDRYGVLWPGTVPYDDGKFAVREGLPAVFLRTGMVSCGSLVIMA